MTINIPYFILNILDDLHLYYIAEKHCHPPYAKRKKVSGKVEEKIVEKVKVKVEEKNQRNITEGFCVDQEKEDQGYRSAWTRESKQFELTENEKRLLIENKKSLDTALIIKNDKLGTFPPMSNREIAKLRHTPGKRDGFSLTTVEEIAKIVAPSIGV